MQALSLTSQELHSLSCGVGCRGVLSQLSRAFFQLAKPGFLFHDMQVAMLLQQQRLSGNKPPCLVQAGAGLDAVGTCQQVIAFQSTLPEPEQGRDVLCCNAMQQMSALANTVIQAAQWQEGLVGRQHI